MNVLKFTEYRTMSDGSRRIVESKSVPARHCKRAAQVMLELQQSVIDSGLRGGIFVTLNECPIVVGVRNNRLEILFVDVDISRNG